MTQEEINALDYGDKLINSKANIVGLIWLVVGKIGSVVNVQTSLLLTAGAEGWHKKPEPESLTKELIDIFLDFGDDDPSRKTPIAVEVWPSLTLSEMKHNVLVDHVGDFKKESDWQIRDITTGLILDENCNKMSILKNCMRGILIEKKE